MPDAPPLTAPPKRRWYQFSLRALFLFITLIALALGIRAQRVRQDREIQQAVDDFCRTQHVAIAYEMRDEKDPHRWDWQMYNDEERDLNDSERWDIIIGRGDRHCPVGAWIPIAYPVSDLGLPAPNGGIPYNDGTNADLKLLQRMPRLRYISIEGATKITDEGIAYLVNLANLEILNLEKSGVTDACVASLEQLPRLRQLTVKKTAITSEVLARLRQSHPNLIVEQ